MVTLNYTHKECIAYVSLFSVFDVDISPSHVDSYW
jgi:hypothetical protein